MWHWQNFFLVTGAMGSVWALLICVLTAWLAKGFCLPVGGTNERRENGQQRRITDLFPDEVSIQKALALFQSMESMLEGDAKEVQLETNEVEAEASVGQLKHPLNSIGKKNQTAGEGGIGKKNQTAGRASASQEIHMNSSSGPESQTAGGSGIGKENLMASGIGQRNQTTSGGGIGQRNQTTSGGGIGQRNQTPSGGGIGQGNQTTSGSGQGNQTTSGIGPGKENQTAGDSGHGKENQKAGGSGQKNQTDGDSLRVKRNLAANDSRRDSVKGATERTPEGDAADVAKAVRNGVAFGLGTPELITNLTVSTSGSHTVTLSVH
ncbi:uncharacterized protein LOC141758336 isoform X2 [Sebastes fasciatus]|uniref:uncharacterized protein LOC141758336 isoform X2 n=1 Tax=Sebastes fasciatus TaxID=394691 RepID=UPI003D9F37EA